jgi:hypothetical protein
VSRIRRRHFCTARIVVSQHVVGPYRSIFGYKSPTVASRENDESIGLLSHSHLFDPDGISIQIRLHRPTGHFTLRNFAPPRQNDVDYFHYSISIVYGHEHRHLSTNKDPTTRIPDRGSDTSRQCRCNHSI